MISDRRRKYLAIVDSPGCATPKDAVALISRSAGKIHDGSRFSMKMFILKDPVMQWLPFANTSLNGYLVHWALSAWVCATFIHHLEDRNQNNAQGVDF